MKLLRKLLRRGLGADNGSTIVGVMAALVFIGIVTGVMVKNTGAQSAASIGYGAAMTMHSTVNSGLVATEGFFLRNQSDTARKIIDSLVNNPATARPIYGGNQNQRIELGSSKQFFSSRTKGTVISDFVTNPNDGYLRAGFQVSAGKNARGRGADSALAFLQIGNLKREQQNFDAPKAKNAFYNNSSVDNADAGMTVDEGGGTFMGSAAFQNAAAIFKKTAYFGSAARFAKDSAIFKDSAFFVNTDSIVEFKVETKFDSLVYFAGPVKFAARVTFKDKVFFMKTAEFDGSAPAVFNDLAYFKGVPKFQSDVEFKGKVYFDNNPAAGVVTFEKAVTVSSSGNSDQWVIFKRGVKFTQKSRFYAETYFGGTVELGNDSLVFYHRVGFNGNVTLNNQKIKTYKNAAGSKFDASISGKITDQNLNNGAGIYGIGSAVVDIDNKKQDVYYSSNFGTVSPATWAKLDALKEFNEKKDAGTTTVLSRFSFDKAPNTPNAIITACPGIPTPPSATDRKDPELSIQPVYADTSRGVVIHNAKNAMTTNNSTFDLGKLQTEYGKALQNPGSLYLGKYMVIEVTSTITFNNPNTTQIFDANIIYIIKEGGALNTSGGYFYSSSADSKANTLIYVGEGNAHLLQFGTMGTFRGFIYIDEGNTADDNSIHFANTGTAKIVGAVHNFSSKRLQWNTGKSQYSTPVVYDPTVLQDFGALYAHKAGNPVATNPTGGVEVNVGGISVRSLGVYFY